MDGMSPLEVMFATESDDDLKTKIAVNHLVQEGRRLGGDYNIDGVLNDGLFLHVSVKITKEKLIYDGMAE